jgi:ferredoxin-NADP reductase
LAFKKVHIFNPAAIAAVLFGLMQISSISWWVATPLLIPSVLTIGICIVHKLRRFDLFLPSLVTAILSAIIFGHSTVVEVFLSWPLVFFTTVMLTEPTTTPSNKGLRLVYGLLVSLLFGLPYQLGPFYSTPELALCIGNLLVFILNPKSRLTLTLVKKNHLSPTVSEFTFTPNTNLRFLAGQYLEWTLPHTKPDTRGNRRFFTIASSPTESSIHLGIKLNSPGSSFKHSLDSLMPNTTLTVSQLSGEFTLPKDPHQKLVFIAGGIGITPFRSMLKYLVDTNSVRNIILFYSCASVDDFVYKDIFSEAEQKISLKTYYVLTTPTPQSPSWINLHGRLTPEYIKTAVPDYQERTYYLSGPQAMVDSYKALLLSLGIKHAHIVTDYFPGF